MRFFFLILFFSTTVHAQSVAEKQHARLVGKAYVQTIKLLIALENKNQKTYETSWLRFLINEAYADPVTSCLLSGWAGQLIGGRCKPSDNQYADAKKNCSSANEVPCNPQYFGTGLCIDKTKAGSRWTNTCYNSFLQKNNFKDGDYEKLGKEILQDKSINLTTVVAESQRLCESIVDKGRDKEDCNQITHLYSEIVRFEHKNPEIKLGIVEHDEKLTKEVDKYIKTPSTKVSPLLNPKDKNTCTSIDLSAKTGDFVYNQGCTGACYAYAAAQIMSYDPKLEVGLPAQDPLRVSPLATAIQHAKNEKRESKDKPENKNDRCGDTQDLAMTGGNISNAIEAANAFGPCSALLWGGLDETKDQVVYGNLIDMYAEFDKARKEHSVNCHSLALTIIDKSFQLFGENFIAMMMRIEEKKTGRKIASDENFTKRLEESYLPILKNSTDIDDFLFDLVDKQCKEIKKNDQNGVPQPIIPSAPKWAKKFYEKSFGQDQDAALNDVYKSLEEGYIQGYSYIPQGLIKPKADKYGGHASIVTGRQYLSEKELPPGVKPGCYLLVKNSYGKGWPDKLSEREHRFNTKKDQAAVYDKEKPGYFWVSEQDFVNHGQATTHIDR